MTRPVHPVITRELASHRTELAPETHEAFQAFSRQVFAAGALPEKTKQLIAVAVAHVTQCPYCIRGHTRIALGKGATEQEIIDAMRLIWARMKIVMEPSSAVPLATILKNRDTFAGKRVGVIITGGNVDLDKLPWLK